MTGRVRGRFRISWLSTAMLASAAIFLGCASPGEPTERKPAVPRAVSDLSGEQSGNDVVLSFALPTETVEGHALDQPPSIEIFRLFESPAAAGPHEPESARLLRTIPSAMVPRYVQSGRVRWADPLEPSDFSAHPDEVAVYTVRTRISPKADSADSNVVRLRLYPAANPIDDLKAENTPSAVVLTWSAPEATLAGPLALPLSYRIYRAELASSPPAREGTSELKPQPALVRTGEADQPPFSDAEAAFGATYQYSVRSVVKYPEGTIESADSNLITITRKDVFPPARPTGLVVVLVPAEGATPAHLELSWAISPETDIAGYNVYRSEQAGVEGTRQNIDLLISPAFRDMKVEPGRRYFYSVTAVDRSGNESAASDVVSDGVPAEGRPTP